MGVADGTAAGGAAERLPAMAAKSRRNRTLQFPHVYRKPSLRSPGRYRTEDWLGGRSGGLALRSAVCLRVGPDAHGRAKNGYVLTARNLASVISQRKVRRFFSARLCRRAIGTLDPASKGPF
jgi:hypothetical protein